jgi:nitrite reductase/ring-hydroxylating ferredoxin subunit
LDFQVLCQLIGRAGRTGDFQKRDQTLRESCRAYLAQSMLTGRSVMNEDNRQSGVAYAICRMSDIPSQQARAFQLMIVADDGTIRPWSIFVLRWGRQVFGYVNNCPHDGVNLDWERNQFLDPNGTRLMCGKHGSLFELGTGKCVDGPCKGRGLTPVALTVLDDDICVAGVMLVEDDEPGPDDEA